VSAVSYYSAYANVWVAVILAYVSHTHK